MLDNRPILFRREATDLQRYRKTFLEEYEALAGTDPIDPYGGDFREDIGQFVINYIAEHGRSPSNREIIENCIPEDERQRLEESRGSAT